MKVSQNWLKELVDINTTPEQLSEKLSIGGFEVESLVDTSSEFKGIVLGKVLSAVKHNNSDKLSICKVDIGTEQLQIICGANNVKSDIFVYVATIGSYLEKIDLTIKATEIRGVYSEGMICSLEELGFEKKSNGIAIVEKSVSQKFELGTPISELLELNDFIYELAITANRPDGMSMIGIAREVSALLQTKLTDIEISEIPPYDLLIYSNDCYFDNNDVVNATLGIEIRDYCGQVPLNQIDSINFGFFAMNWGAMAQNLETSINVNNASGNTLYSNTETYGLLNPGDSISLYHSNIRSLKCPIRHHKRYFRD